MFKTRKIILTVEELQDQIDYVRNKFQENCSKVESFESQINVFAQANQALMAQVTSVLSDLCDLHKAQDDLKGDLKDSVASCTAYNVRCRNKYEELESRLDGFVETSCSLNSMAKQNNSDVEYLKNEVKRIGILSSQLSNLKDLVNSVQTSNSNALVGHNDKISDLKDSINSMKQTLCDLQMSQGSNFSIMDDLQKKMMKLQKEISFNGEANLNHVNQNIKEIKSYFLSLIDQIKIPDTSNLIKKEDLTYASSGFERASLDARNANLRSTNNEQKISLMEKKIEQLQLLLNRYQLQE